MINWLRFPRPRSVRTQSDHDTAFAQLSPRRSGVAQASKAVTSGRIQYVVRIRLPETIFAFVACALALALAAPPAVAAGGCGGPADSALNQYCESIPTPRGSQP